LVRLGILFLGLSLVFAVFLLTTFKLTKQLVGTSKAIEQAGTERMRIYKLASLIQQLTPASKIERELIRNEIVRFEQVMKGLRIGTSEHGSVDSLSPMLSVELETLEDRWLSQLKPTLELALENGTSTSRGQGYLSHTESFVDEWDHFVQSMEKQSAARMQFLYKWQAWFLVLFAGLLGVALNFLDRVVRIPLKQLTASAERLAEGDLHTEIQVHSEDELGRLARTFKRMAETIQQKIGELNALHATGQEIGLLGSGGLDDALKRIADRAAESLDADIAVVLVRHPTMECWMMETASGTAFDRLRKEILLFEETPFSNQAYETKRPVIVADLAAHKDKPIRFRDEFAAQSYMAVPLLGPHECPGVLVLLSVARQRTFSEWDIQMAQQFASYAAVTMENVRLFDAVESESHDLREQLHELERKVAELTHEVKAPAGRVAEFASWIERDYASQLGPKGLQYIAWIKNEGKDLAALAERTLDLARINQQPSPLERVDLDSVVREVFTLLKQDCLAGNVEVIIAPDLPQLACRRIHVKQVFENLIGNAIKYMGNQPHPLVEIGTVEGPRGILVFVRDNGIGIEPTMSERIFLPFVRLGTGNIVGAGIGLSIVKTVVDQYEGSVTVDSTPGVGSTFFVRLPLIVRNPTMTSGMEQPVVTQP